MSQQAPTLGAETWIFFDAVFHAVVLEWEFLFKVRYLTERSVFMVRRRSN